jgi:hypothetical protein
MFFFSTVAWTQGFMLARHALYYLSHFTSTVLCWLFFGIGSHELYVWYWLWTIISPSQVARITGVSHWALPYSCLKHYLYLFSSLGTFCLKHPEAWQELSPYTQDCHMPHREKNQLVSISLSFKSCITTGISYYIAHILSATTSKV